MLSPIHTIQTSISCSDVGSISFEITATYAEGAITQSSNINVFDVTDPVAVAQDISVSIDESTGLATITSEMIDNGSSDNCGIKSMELSKTVFSCSDVGENQVTLTVTDNSDRVATVTAMVNVESFISEITLSSNDTEVCFDGTNETDGSTITTSGSETGVEYTLYKKSDDSVIDGPIDGTGSALTFDVGAISENTTFYLGSEIPASGGSLNMPTAGVHLLLSSPDALDYTQGYTFSAWFKIPSGGISNRYHALFFAGTSGASDIEVYTNAITGTLTVVHNRGGATQASTITSTSVLPNNEFAHLAVSHDGDNLKVYINGSQVHSASMEPPVKTTGSQLAFGQILNTAWQAIAAETSSEIMDDLRVYNKGLSQEEIQADYNRPLSGTEDDLVLYFPLDESNAGVATNDLVNDVQAQIVGNAAIITTDFGVSTSFNCTRIMADEITIGDNVAPTVVATDLTLDLGEKGKATINSDMVTTSISDNCTSQEDLSITMSKTSFTCSDEGDVTVTISVTDDAGNTTEATSTVTVLPLIDDQTLSTNAASICPGEEAFIEMAGSQSGILYSLQKETESGFVGVGESYLGDGNALSLSTGTLDESATFQVVAKNDVGENNSLKLGSTNDYFSIATPSSFDYSLGYTFESWVKTELPVRGAGHKNIFEAKGDTGSDIEIYVQETTQLLTIVHNRGNGASNQFIQFGEVPNNEFFHLAVTFDGTNAAIYYDGELKSSQALTAPAKTSNSILNFGYFENSGWNTTVKSFNGELDEIRVWSATRSSEELSDNMSNTVTPSDDLMVYFKLDETRGTQVKEEISGDVVDILNAGDGTTQEDGVVVDYVSCEVIFEDRFTFTPGDSEAPTVLTKDITIGLGSNSSVSISTSDIDAGSSDNCTSDGDLTISLDVSTFTVDDLGDNTVTLTVEDASGNVGTGTAIVTVIDKTQQVISFRIVEEKIYGVGSFDLIASSDSGLPVSFKLISGPANLSGSTLSITGAGNVTVEAAQEGDDTYAPASEQQTFTVSKAQLMVTTDDKTITYGEAIPTLTATYAGFVNGEDVVALDVAPGLATDASESSDVGSYDILLEGGVSENYEFSFNSGILTIEKADQTISIDPIQDQLISADPFDLVASSSSGLDLSYSVTGPASIGSVGEFARTAEISSTTITLDGTEGTVTITATQQGNTNYNSSSNSVSFEVIDPNQVITFDEISAKTYGDVFSINPSVNTGLPLDVEIVSGPASISENTITITGVGDIVVEVSQEGEGLYSPASVQRTFTVNKAALQVVADDHTITYGADIPELTFSYSGFVNNENESVFTAIPVASLDVTIEGLISAGSYAIELSGGDANNYEFQYQNATLTVNKADQTISIDPIDDKQPTDDPFEVIASVDSGLDLTYDVTGPATISSTTVTLTGEDGEVTLTVSQTGDNNHNAASESLTFMVTSPLSTNLESSIEFFPNPVINKLTFNTREELQVRVLSLDGREIVNTVAKGEIDLSGLKMGTYLLEIEEDNHLVIKRIIKIN